ncbi:hypothetical protein OEG86_15250 [Hoeflea alexandrii]|uniref:hypothetical protein n=1 Tax=Hoeflea alexandrii TaxID=288436 RepID=UPI00226ED7B9|nr:hypothetical protein [Hoeflea alexandrii]MCY0153376.1 hypothetical protein [Hoeflea alexandrii]
MTITSGFPEKNCAGCPQQAPAPENADRADHQPDRQYELGHRSRVIFKSTFEGKEAAGGNDDHRQHRRIRSAHARQHQTDEYHEGDQDVLAEHLTEIAQINGHVAGIAGDDTTVTGLAGHQTRPGPAHG